MVFLSMDAFSQLWFGMSVTGADFNPAMFRNSRVKSAGFSGVLYGMVCLETHTDLQALTLNQMPLEAASCETSLTYTRFATG
jgi:hypothetical protein